MTVLETFAEACIIAFVVSLRIVPGPRPHAAHAPPSAAAKSSSADSQASLANRPSARATSSQLRSYGAPLAQAGFP